MDTRKSVAASGLLVLATAIIFSSTGFSPTTVGILSSALIIACLAVSVQMIYAMLGELSLGQSAIFGTAAFAYAVVTVNLHDPGLGILIGLLLALIMGAVIGGAVCNVTHAYFSVITYAISFLCGVIVRGSRELGGSEGLLGLDPLPTILTGFYNADILIYAGIAFLLSVTLLYFTWRSPIGLSLEAIRADRWLARSFGINTRLMVVVAYVLSAIPAGLAGVVFAGTGRYVGPTAFELYYVVIPIAVMALGGTRSLLGTLTGCLLLVAVPLWLSIGALESQILAGLALAIAVIVLPKGINDALLRGVRLVVRRTGRWKVGLPRRSEPAESSPIETTEPAFAAGPTAPLRASGVVVRFGGNTAVDSVDLQIAPGEIVGLIGPNGAGKTTLVNAITGLVPLAAGDVEVDGRLLTKVPAHGRARAGLARTFQTVALVEVLSVHQNFLIAQARGRVLRTGLRLPRLTAAAQEAVTLCGLGHLLDTKVSELTNLERRVLAVGLTLAANPKYILLDEPTAGLSPQDRVEFVRVVRRVVEHRGVGVLVIEHDVEFVTEIANRIVAMHQGKVIADGVPAVVLNDSAVVSSYLGGDWSRARA